MEFTEFRGSAAAGKPSFQLDCSRPCSQHANSCLLKCLLFSEELCGGTASSREIMSEATQSPHTTAVTQPGVSPKVQYRHCKEARPRAFPYTEAAVRAEENCDARCETRCAAHQAAATARRTSGCINRSSVQTEQNWLEKSTRVPHN